MEGLISPSRGRAAEELQQLVSLDIKSALAE
jgi:hypothetical protein